MRTSEGATRTSERSEAVNNKQHSVLRRNGSRYLFSELLESDDFFPHSI